jgi:outer membrane receptor protein involved in Fe transport
VNLAGSVDDRLDLSGGFEAGRTEFDGNLQDRVGFGRSDMIRAAYVSARVRPGVRTALDLGLRYEDVRWVSDVVLEPRAVLSVRPGAGTVFKAGYRRVHQHPYSFLRRSGASIVFDNEYDGYEMFRDGELGAKRVDHYSVSGEFEPGAAIAVSAEAYLKRYSNLGTWLVDSEGVRTGYGNDGHGSARGFEFVLEHRAKAGWSGQATYGLAWCRKQEGTDTMPYWDEYDRRHSFNLSVMKEWPGDWRLTTTFHLHTGSPYTPLIYTRSRRELGGSDLNRGGFGWVIEGEKNSLRVPIYHRLDLKLQKELSHLPLKPFFYIEVLNLYNRQNVYHLVQFENRDGEIRTGRFTGIQFIPLIGMGGRF